MPDGPGDFVSNGNIVGGQVNVEGDQRMPGSDHCRAGARQPGGSKIGIASGNNAKLLFECFILSSANILKIDPLGLSGSLLIQVNRDLQRFTNALTQATRHLNTFCHGYPGNRNKGDDISGANPGMLALVLIQVNQFARFGNRQKRRLFNAFRRPHKGDHCPVVIQI
ncbi:MAG: hypothetical protein BWX85_00971 [Chloroflexi bacterium ADurb.Bin120]|nr:MAG: hypothetical protein BWX85_00971 [Chloroflexi bacterium ADurb.Bin120]